MNSFSRRFRPSFSNSPRRAARHRANRRLRAEQLEGRMLLAADLFHNDLRSSDVNNDGFVAPIDVLLVINALSQNGAAAEGGTGGKVYLDTNNDGQLSPIDALVPINDILLGAGEGSALVSYQPIALASTLVSAPQFGGFSFVDNGSTDQIVIQGSGRSWLTAGFAAGSQVLISDSGVFVDTAGSPDADTRLHNNGLYTVVSATPDTLTVQGDLITAYPANVRDVDDNGDPIAGTPFISSSALFFRPITAVPPGGNFLLGVVVEDLRTMTDTGAPFPNTSKGVFSAYVDVTFDTTDVNNSSTVLTRHNNYTGSVSGNFATPGLIDEAGASAFGGQVGVPVGAREQLVFRAPFTASTTPGQTTIDTNPADISPANDTLLFGINTKIPDTMIRFESLTLNIVTDILAVADTATVAQDGGPIFINVLANDSTSTGTVPTITTPIPTTSANGGTVAQATVGGVTGFNYTPAAGFNGQDTFSYTITNGTATATAPVTITVGQVGVPVITGPNSINTNEDTPFTLSGFTITDSNSTNITVTLTANGALSQTTFSGTPQEVTTMLNAVTYTPIANSNAADTINISASDGALTGMKAVGITINPVNDPPINTINGLGNPPTAAVANTETLTFPTGTFVVTDADPTNTITVTISVQNGTLTSGANTGTSLSFTGSSTVNIGSLTYDPTDTFVGTETLTITSSDGTLMDVDTVAITVAPPQFPFAASNSYSINEGSGPFTLNPNPLDNDLRDPGATLTVTNVSPANVQGGMLVFANGNFTYTPPANPDFFGTETFTYTIEQDAAHTPSSTGDTSSTGTITINVVAVNDAPINTVPGARTVNEDSTLAFTGANLISIQDIDAGTGNVTVTLTANNGTINVTAGAGVSNNGSKSVSINGTLANVNTTLGSLTYTPDLNFFGSDVLTVTTNDNGNTGGGALTDVDTVNITVAPVNDAPTIMVPGSQTAFNTNTDNRFSSTPNPFRIADIDAGNNNVQVDLTIADGTISFVNSAGVTVSQNPGGNNGVRLSGTVANINTVLAAGVTYRTSVEGMKTLTATVNDLGNVGTGGPMMATATVALTVRDFVPADVTGQIFMDDDGDGQKDPQEAAIGGVKVTLTGTDFQGNTISVMATTNAQGHYLFPAVAPNLAGSPYTITRESSIFFLPGPNQTTIDLDINGNVVLRSGSLNFAQGGFTPEFADVWRLFALSEQGTNSSGILFGIQGTQKFSLFTGNGWDVSRFSNARFVPGADGNSGRLTVFDGQAGQDRSVDVSTLGGTLTYRGVGADRVYRVIGSSSLLGAVNNGANPEAEGDATTNAAAYASGVDALFAGGF